MMTSLGRRMGTTSHHDTIATAGSSRGMSKMVMSVGLATLAFLAFLATIVTESSWTNDDTNNNINLAQTTSYKATEQQQQERDLVLTSNTAIKYKFSFDECVGMSAEECQSFISENIMPFHVLKDVTLDITSIQTSSTTFMTEPQDVYIQVNTKGQVLGGGKISRRDGISMYDDSAFDMMGHVGFVVDGHTYGQPCSGLSYDQCCRNVQRSYQRRIHTESLKGDGVMSYERVEEEINRTNLHEFDRHCQKEIISPLAEVYEGRQDSVSFQEYIYNDSTGTFELDYIDANQVVMTLTLETSNDNQVSEIPRLCARMAYNPTHEFLTSYLRHNEDSSSMTSTQMTIVGTTDAAGSNNGSLDHMLATVLQRKGSTIHIAWLPLIVLLSMMGGCCFCVVFFCCIPVKDADDWSLDSDDVTSHPKDFEETTSRGTYQTSSTSKSPPNEIL